MIAKANFQGPRRADAQDQPTGHPADRPGTGTPGPARRNSTFPRAIAPATVLLDFRVVASWNQLHRQRITLIVGP